jgi:hypothetical protein
MKHKPSSHAEAWKNMLNVSDTKLLTELSLISPRYLLAEGCRHGSLVTANHFMSRLIRRYALRCVKSSYLDVWKSYFQVLLDHGYAVFAGKSSLTCPSPEELNASRIAYRKKHHRKVSDTVNGAVADIAEAVSSYRFTTGSTKLLSIYRRLLRNAVFVADTEELLHQLKFWKEAGNPFEQPSSDAVKGS